MNLDFRIKELETEAQTVIQNLRRFQEVISHNEARFQQIRGALNELRTLKEQNNDNTNNGGVEPALTADRLPDSGNRDRRDRRTGMVHRELVKPDSSHG